MQHAHVHIRRCIYETLRYVSHYLFSEMTSQAPSAGKGRKRNFEREAQTLGFHLTGIRENMRRIREDCSRFLYIISMFQSRQQAVLPPHPPPFTSYVQTEFFSSPQQPLAHGGADSSWLNGGNHVVNPHAGQNNSGVEGGSYIMPSEQSAGIAGSGSSYVPPMTYLIRPDGDLTSGTCVTDPTLNQKLRLKVTLLMRTCLHMYNMLEVRLTSTNCS